MNRAMTLAAGLLAAALFLAAAADAAEGRALKIAVVDVNLARRKYNKNIDSLKKVEEVYRREKERLQRKANELNEEMRRMAADPRSANNIEKIRDEQALQLNIAKLKAEEKLLALQRTKEEIDIMNEVFDDLEAAVAEYARDNGLDLVIKHQLPEHEPENSKDYFHRMLRGRTVLYCTDQLEITDEIIKLLNKKYERAGGAPVG